MARHHAPQNALDAKFSAEFAIAAALIAGEVSLAVLRDDFVRSAPVQALMAKVHLTATDEADADEPLFSPFDTVRVTCRDGGVRASEPVRHAKGHAKNPIAMEALRAKFDDCTRALRPRQRGALFDCLACLETLPSVSRLYDHA
jgi:2-methylcitrate dehydratase PrpD